MTSYSESHNSLHPHSLNLQSITLNQYKKKPKYTKGIHKINLLYEHQRKKGDFKYLKKYVHRYFISFYKNTKNDYNIRMIEDILNNESTHLVAEFKDYLIMGDFTEFLQKSYNIEECKKYLPKIYEYYNSCSVIFPNYVKLHESKYIYKNIRKKQKVIDNQQEQEEKQEKIKKGEIKYNENDDFFTTKTFYSILDQTNTSYAKLFFGINDKIDANETPNNIVEKLKQAEKEAIKKKIHLIKNSSKLNINMKENNTVGNINNSNIHKRNNSKIYTNKNKSIKERNKNNSNIHYLSQIQKKKINNTKNNSHINIKMNINQKRNEKMRIHKYLKKKNDSKRHIKSSSSINETENDTNRKKNYITFYGNKLITSKKKETKKVFYENSNNKKHNIFINTRNNSNKNIKKQYINSLLPTKTILTRIFNNFNNSALAHNSYNFINKKLQKINITEENKNKISTSPSSITIQANSFRKKRKYNINLKESKSTRNIINNKLNVNNKSKEKIDLNNFQQKIINRNKNQNYIFDYNSNTLPITTNSNSKNSKEKIKIIHKNSNPNYKNIKMSNNISNFKTVVSNARSNSNINNIPNTNNNNNANTNKNNNYNNMHKINSTSNIKSPMNMNININMNNNKNKIYLSEVPCTNIMENKIFQKSPFSLELETIKVTKRKKIFYPKKSEVSKKKNSNTNNQNFKHNITNTNNNTTSKDKNYYLDSLVHTSSNSNNQNDDIINNIYVPTSTININNTKKDLILEELYKKKNIILPLKKEINNFNININGYNIHGGSLTSRTSNNVSKNKNNKNNLISKKEGNPVKIKKIFEKVRTLHSSKTKSLGHVTIKKK